MNCVYTHTTTTCLHHCTHSGQSCAGGGKEGRLYIFFFFFSFFILSKEGTKSQPSFKPSAAQEPPTSPKELRLCGNPDLTSSPPSTEAVLAFEQYRQKVLPKVYALLGRVKLCQDRERGTRKSLGLNRPFPSVSYRKSPVITHIAFPRADLGGLWYFWR